MASDGLASTYASAVREARALRIAEDAIDLADDERQAWLAGVCDGDDALRRRVERILHAGLNDIPMNTAATQRIVADYLMPVVIPNYRILNLIGSGGMGDVYEAERIDGEFSQTVAVKVVKLAGRDEKLRDQFLVERQILASLHHPSIVTLLDGGTTEHGLPFFTTELVDGKRLDDYIADNNPSLKQRFRLFDQICAAVEHAHSSLIVHRDIKPSNILVQQDGTPKLLDFGIAKVLSDDLDHKTLIGALTPTFASPEQIAGKPLSIATDIYSLGAILYYLLTESFVYETANLSQLEAARIVLEGAPEKPSQRVRRSRPRVSLPKELDAIVLKALALEPERRYRSMGAFRDDLQNFLLRRPVSAKPDSRWYRTSKFVTRHKVGVAASTLSILALVAGLFISIEQTSRANEQLAKAEAIGDFMGDLLMSPASRWDVDISAGPDARMSDVLEVAGQHIQSELTDHPDVQVKLLSRVAIALERLSKNDLSVELSQRAMNIAQNIDSDELRLQALVAHGKNLTRRGRSEIGLQALMQAREQLELQGQARSIRYVYLLNDIGNALGTFDRFEEQLATINLALQLYDELVGDPGHPALAGGLNHKSGVLIRLGRLSEARQVSDQALNIVALERNRNDVVRAYVHMYAAALNAVDMRLDKAEEHAHISIHELGRTLGKQTKEHGVAHARLSYIQTLRGNLAGARASLRKAQAITRAVHYESGRDQQGAEILLLGHGGLYTQVVDEFAAADFAGTTFPISYMGLFELGVAHIKTGNAEAGYALAQQAYNALAATFTGELLTYLNSRIKALALDSKRIVGRQFAKSAAR